MRTYQVEIIPKSLAIKLKLQDDEIFSSWLTRLAISHGLHGYQFSIWLAHLSGELASEPDRKFPENSFKFLSIVTGTEVERIKKSTFFGYVGYLVDEIPYLGPIPWVIPGGYYTGRKHQGTQFCRKCLSEDTIAYFRSRWRLSFSTVCSKHNILLENKCPSCLHPVRIYRNQVQVFDNKIWPINVCYECGFDLREEISSSKKDLPYLKETELQSHLEEVLRDGWVNNKTGVNHSVVYFKGIRLLMGFLSGRSGQKLRNALTEYYKLEFSSEGDFSKSSQIELRNQTERRHLNIYVSCLLSDWPNGFVEICRSIGYRYKPLNNTAIRTGEFPFWYWTPISEHLFSPFYEYTEQEIQSAHQYIQKNDHIRRSGQVRELFGVGIYLHLLKRKLFQDKVIKQIKEDHKGRRCVHCKAKKKQYLLKRYTKRPPSNLRFVCKSCNRTYIVNK